MKIAKLQMSKGAYFLFEHPAHATSWEMPSVKEVFNKKGVNTVIGDQCMYGLVTPNADRSAMVPAKKPTRFVSNGWYILKELDTKCDKSHTHQALMGGRASKAQEYTYTLCRAMCRGLRGRRSMTGVERCPPIHWDAPS